MQSDLWSFINKARPYRLWLVLLIIFLVFLYVFKQIEGIIFPFLISFIGAYALNMPMKKMEHYGISRSMGAFLLITIVFSFLGLFVVWAVPFVKQELYILIKAYPEIQKKIFNFILPYTKSMRHLVGDISVEQLQAQLSDSLGNILKWSISFIISLFSNGFAIANILSLVILTPLIMFYFLKDWPAIIKKLNGFLPNLYAEKIRTECVKVDKALAEYAYGQFFVSLTLIVCYMICLWLVDLPYALFVGFFSGFLTFIPYLGIVTGFLLALTIAITSFDHLSQIFMVIAIYIFFSTLESYYLTPKLVGKRIGLHPVLIIFSLLALGSWFGLMGVIFALPLASIISTLMRSFMTWYDHNFVRMKN